MSGHEYHVGCFLVGMQVVNNIEATGQLLSSGRLPAGNRPVLGGLIASYA